jgi:putative transposase
MDLYSRRIIGWKIGSNMEAELVTKALNRALILRIIKPSKLFIPIKVVNILEANIRNY